MRFNDLPLPPTPPGTLKRGDLKLDPISDQVLVVAVFGVSQVHLYARDEPQWWVTYPEHLVESFAAAEAPPLPDAEKTHERVTEAILACVPDPETLDNYMLVLELLRRYDGHELARRLREGETTTRYWFRNLVLALLWEPQRPEP